MLARRSSAAALTLVIALVIGCGDGVLKSAPDLQHAADATVERAPVADGPTDVQLDRRPGEDASVGDVSPAPDAARDRGTAPQPDVTRDGALPPDTTRDRGVTPAADATVDRGSIADTTVDSVPIYTGSFPAASPGFSSATLQVAGIDRDVEIYLPADLPANAPLMILFHGTDGVASDAIWGADATTLAESSKVIMVAPQARTMAVGDWDNHVAGQRYFETYPNVDPDTNPDLLLVRAIIAETARAYGANRRRVYTLGFSNGAFFSLFVAMMLPDRIAAFAENSGGLVRCATTASCTFRGTGTSCADLASQAGYCACTGVEKPGPTATSGRKPPGYIVHSSNDSTVSVYYSCALATRMQALGYPMTVTIRASGGHSWQPNFATMAWSFLSQHQLP